MGQLQGDCSSPSQSLPALLSAVRRSDTVQVRGLTSVAKRQIEEKSAKLGVFVSVVSTHIPFAGASKVRVLQMQDWLS